MTSTCNFIKINFLQQLLKVRNLYFTGGYVWHILQLSQEKETERSVQVKPPVEEDSPSTDSDDIASVKDSVEPGTTCKKEALAGDDDAEIDSEEKTLIFNP